MEMPESAALRPAKRVTDSLDDKVKARLRGDGEWYPPPAGYPYSSGSEHDSGGLSGFVRGFFFSDNECSDGAGEAEDYNEERGEGELDGAAGLMEREEGERSFYAAPVAAIIRDLVAPRVASAAEDGRFRHDLAGNASGAAEMFADLRANRSAFLRAVMGALREVGYDAGICKSRWESSGGGLVAGSYEYIDVVRPPLATDARGGVCSQQRYIVEVDFAGEFEIARPTGEYERLVAELPGMFVGKPDDLRPLLRILVDAVRRSLHSREMHVPPWRKSRYMQAKWLGPFHRSINPVPSYADAAAAAPSFGPVRGRVKCRYVGFDTAAPVLIGTAARTR